MSDESPRKERFQVVVLGAERAGVEAPNGEIVLRDAVLVSHPYDTLVRLCDFDGAVVFQGIFETIKRKHYMENTVTDHRSDADMLHRRENELRILLEDGGFACLLLRGPFNDDLTDRSTETDLGKAILSRRQFVRRDFRTRTTDLVIKRDELREFLQLWGAATSCFAPRSSKVESTVIATVNDDPVSLLTEERVVILPTLMPSAERAEEFFTSLIEGVLALLANFRFEVPRWVQEFRFDRESTLERERVDQLDKLREVEDEIGRLGAIKRVLSTTGDALVAAVRDLLATGFGFSVDDYDDLREDLKILSDSGEPRLFLEVKGTSRGVKREYINQTDSHRERAGLTDSVPAVLVINTHAKNARSLDDKDRPVPAEQVRHATNMKVLIVRTLDLLVLLRNFQRNLLTSAEVLELLSASGGWLHVVDGNATIEKGEEPANQGVEPDEGRSRSG